MWLARDSIFTCGSRLDTSDRRTMFDAIDVRTSIVKSNLVVVEFRSKVSRSKASVDRRLWLKP